MIGISKDIFTRVYYLDSSFQRITSVILIQSPNILQLFQKYLTLTYK